MKINQQLIHSYSQIQIFTLFFIILMPYVALSNCWNEFHPIPVNDDPGLPDPHHNSGNNRIVRIQDTLIILCPNNKSGGESLWRSENNGKNWTKIDQRPFGVFSGSIITGPNNEVYYFFKENKSIKMINFNINEQVPLPVPKVVYSDNSVDITKTGNYDSVAATIDSNGDIFVFAHWGNPDVLYCIVSNSLGHKWHGPYKVSPDSSSSWYYPRCQVSDKNILICTFTKYARYEVRYSFSEDQGVSWNSSVVPSTKISNVSLLSINNGIIFLFGQSGEQPFSGLVFNRSNNGGTDWKGWRLVDQTCGYADPSAALGSDGQTIYIAYRSSNGTDVTDGTCGDQSRFRLAMSPDLGQTWSFPDKHYDADRTGTRNHIRYQTWYNYGGPLEWVWMQYENANSSSETRKIYYDTCKDKAIFNIQSTKKRLLPANIILLKIMPTGYSFRHYFSQCSPLEMLPVSETSKETSHIGYEYHCPIF